MPQESKRGIQAPHSPIRKLNRFADQAEKQGKEIFRLNIGQPDIPSPASALEAVRKDQNEIIGYGSSNGIISLREIYAKYYQKFGAQIGADDVFVTTGASEAITFVLGACCDSGDEVIIPEPFYANYIGSSNFCSVKVVPVSSYLEEEFKLPSIQDFKTKITDRTKAILLCNPGNPTGKVYSKDDLEEMIKLVIEKDLFLIVDEVYKEFCYNADFYSVLQFKQATEHVIVIDSISKIFSLCGARIGFISTKNESIKSSVSKFAQMRLCAPYFGQIMAISSFQNIDSYLQKVKKEYRLRRDTLYKALSSIDGINTYLPEGAFYIIAGLPVDDAELFCQWMLSDFSYKNKTVMFAPAAGFYANASLGRNQIRIAFILNCEAIKEAIECLEVGLLAFNKRLNQMVGKNISDH